MKMVSLRQNYSVIAFLMVLSSHALAIYGLSILETANPVTVSTPVIKGVLITATAMAVPAITKAVPEKQRKKIPENSKKPIPQKSLTPETTTLADGIQEKTLTIEQAAITETSTDNTSTNIATSTAEEDVVLMPPRVDASNLENTVPDYPRLSRRLGETGTVILEILILPDGTVAEMRLHTSSGYKRLDNAALKAVKHWRYLPAKRGNEPISYWYMQPVSFTLN